MCVREEGGGEGEAHEEKFMNIGYKGGVMDVGREYTELKRSICIGGEGW